MWSTSTTGQTKSLIPLICRREPFRLTAIHCADNRQLSDSGLAIFRDCRNLGALDLAHTDVSDAGLGNFQDCRNLKQLGLPGTHVTDRGLAFFKECKNLNELFLDDTQVGDAGLAHFADRDFGVFP